MYILSVSSAQIQTDKSSHPSWNERTKKLKEITDFDYLGDKARDKDGGRPVRSQRSHTHRSQLQESRTKQRLSNWEGCLMKWRVGTSIRHQICWAPRGRYLSAWRFSLRPYPPSWRSYVSVYIMAILIYTLMLTNTYLRWSFKAPTMLLCRTFTLTLGDWA